MGPGLIAAGVVAAAAITAALGAAARSGAFSDRDASEPCESCPGRRCRGAPLHEQQQPMSCVLASSRMIIQQTTGHDPGEAALRDSAQTAGWYDPVQGSNPWRIPELLRDHGVEAVARNALTLEDIAAATADGDPVMVGLKNPGHRIVVDGVRTDPDGTRRVLVRDPGYGGDDGCRELPEAEFLSRYNDNAPVILLSDGGRSGGGR